MRYSQSPSEVARGVRAELETIAAALRVDELAQLVVLGRRLLDASAESCAREVKTSLRAV